MCVCVCVRACVCTCVYVQQFWTRADVSALRLLKPKRMRTSLSFILHQQWATAVQRSELRWLGGGWEAGVGRRLTIGSPQPWDGPSVSRCGGVERGPTLTPLWHRSPARPHALLWTGKPGERERERQPGVSLEVDFPRDKSHLLPQCWRSEGGRERGEEAVLIRKLTYSHGYLKAVCLPLLIWSKTHSAYQCSALFTAVVP